jgi:mannose-6-phosphate isomerase-like protein (cupin superfamily)
MTERSKTTGDEGAAGAPFARRRYYTASLRDPEEQLTKGGVRMDIGRLGGMLVKRMTYPTGWRFSQHMGAPSCRDTHVGYVISGQLRVRLDEGPEFDLNTGDAFFVPPGHDAWVVGGEPAMIVQFDEGESALRRYTLDEETEQAA